MIRNVTLPFVGRGFPRKSVWFTNKGWSKVQIKKPIRVQASDPAEKNKSHSAIVMKISGNRPYALKGISAKTTALTVRTAMIAKAIKILFAVNWRSKE